jgi:hypothetical protein
MPYQKAEAAKPLEVTGVYVVSWLKILAPTMFGAVLAAAGLRKA